MSNSAYSQFQLETNYPEIEPESPETSETLISVDDEAQSPHTLFGGFYTTRNGLKSNLLINNKGPRPIEIAPTLYGETGGVLQIPRITVERNSAITINLSDWANLGGEGFQQGNIKLFHRGKALVLGIQIQIFDEAKSLVFESKLSELGNFDSRRLEGVWWIPNNNTDSTIVLTNTGGQYVTVTATLTRRPHIAGTTQTFNLLPHQTKVLNVRDDFPQGNVFAKLGVLGLSLTHNGAEESLLAWTMIKDESKGYSNVATFTNPAKVKSNQYHGAGLQLGSVGGDGLEPVLVLSNTTNANVDVNIKVPYTKQDGTNGTVSINTVRLNPREVNEVNMQAVINLNNIRTAGIEIVYTGNPGGVVASAQSVSASGNQVFRTLLWDPPSLKSAASLYSFSIEGTSSTKAFIKNAGFKDENYLSHISWGTDGKYIIPVSLIKKGETIEIDVKKLRDEQIPDERGNVIPQDVSKGQIHWSLRRSESTLEASIANKVPLVGQAMQIDIAKGISYSYFCLNCCEYAAYSFATLVPGNAQLQHPGGYQYRILEDGYDCYGNPLYGRDVTRQGYDWSSTNTSVATVTNMSGNGSRGFVTAVGAGQTQIKTKIQLPNSEFYGHCTGGGGPLRAEVLPIDKICNEATSLAGAGDNQVSFDRSVFEQTLKDETAQRPDDCYCVTTSPEHQESANLTVTLGTPTVNSLTATIPSTGGGTGEFSTTNTSLEFALDSSDLMVVFKGGDNITIQAQGSGNLSQIRWKEVERDPNDTVDTNGLPTLSSQTGASVTLTASRAGNFRLISYYDANNNGVFDDGEQLKVLKFVVVLITNSGGPQLIKNYNEFQDASYPFSNYSVINNSVIIEAQFYLASGGSTGTLGLDKVETGVVGNITVDNLTVFYTDPEISTAVGTGTSTPNASPPLVVDPKTNNSFRSNSVQSIVNELSVGQVRYVTAEQNISTGDWAGSFPNCSQCGFWQSVSGGRTYNEYLAAYSQSFQSNYVGHA